MCVQEIGRIQTQTANPMLDSNCQNFMQIWNLDRVFFRSRDILRFGCYILSITFQVEERRKVVCAIRSVVILSITCATTTETRIRTDASSAMPNVSIENGMSPSFLHLIRFWVSNPHLRLSRSNRFDQIVNESIANSRSYPLIHEVFLLH